MKFPLWPVNIPPQKSILTIVKSKINISVQKFCCERFGIKQFLSPTEFINVSRAITKGKQAWISTHRASFFSVLLFYSFNFNKMCELWVSFINFSDPLYPFIVSRSSEQTCTAICGSSLLISITLVILKWSVLPRISGEQSIEKGIRQHDWRS